MIRVNLLGERKSLKKKVLFGTSQQLTVGCSVILVATGLLIGWRYVSLVRESRQLDTELSIAQKETSRLHTIIVQVQQFEQRKTQLQQRVGLIEQLRKDQTGPVHMLDQISRALPPMLWLTGLKQTPLGSDVVIDGRCATLTGLSDFVANLESSGYFKRSVEIVSTTAESAKDAGEMIKFQIRAVFQRPTDEKAVSSGKPAARSGA